MHDVHDRPARHRLLPGLAVVRRDQVHLQVGIDPPHRAVLPDREEVRQLLERLESGTEAPTDPVAARALAALTAAGLVCPMEDAPATQLGLDGPPDLVETATALAPGPVSLNPARAPVVLVLSAGVLARERLDPYLREDVPHLPVVGDATGWSVGPLVVPGMTACLRCVDAARAEDDPRRPVVLAQATARSPVRPPDPLLSALAIGAGLRDLVAYVHTVCSAGSDATLTRLPTWSATLSLSLESTTRHRWLPHPHCGCCWDALGRAG